jgi:hypothetical protein
MRKASEFERDTYPVDQPKHTLTTFFLEIRFEGCSPIFSRNLPSSKVLDADNHDLISSYMDCIHHVLPHLDFRTGELSNRPAWHLRVFLARRTRVARIPVSTPRMFLRLLIVGDSAVRLLVTLGARSAW